MLNKRGLSAVVSTIIIVGLVLVVLGIVGAVIFVFAREGTSQLSPSKYTVRVGIASANVNYSTGMAVLRVSRDLGTGDLVALKFIFEDLRSSEVYDYRVIGFDELEERTFDIYLNPLNSSLALANIYKVSVAPVILLDSGEEVIGIPSEPVEGLNRGLNQSDEVLANGGEDEGICYSNIQCGSDYLINGTRYCLDNFVHQYKKTFECILGFCDEGLEDVIVENCSYECFDGECVDEVIACTPATVTTDCGMNGLIGIPACSQDGTKVIQDYKSYSCINNSCSVTITSSTIEECNESEVCFNAECFIPVECTTHADCDPGEICVEGICVIEEIVNSGIISSIWPFSIGEYFDSPSLLNPLNTSLVNYYIVFPGSNQEGCLKINEHKVPNVTGAAPYVRLNVTVSNISTGNNFQVWETSYICGFY